MFNKNQLIDVEITDITNDGEGVGKVDGFTFFIKDTIIGDRATVKVIKVKKNYGYARLEKLIEPSKDRIEPLCKVSRSCGGCQIQCMSYQAQLKFKENKVKNNLVRLGGFDKELIDNLMEPIIGMNEAINGSPIGFGYRNKAQFPFGLDKEGNIICGFYAGRTHSIISNTDCLLGVPENKIILEKILSWMKKYRVMPYDEITHKGIVRHALIRKGFYSGEIMVCLVINKDDISHKDELIDELITVKGMNSISLSINKNDTNVIMGDDYKTIWGSDTISDKLLGLDYNISPLSFYQVNPIQVEKLYSTAIDYADLDGSEEVWDLCCGIGTITLSVAKRMEELNNRLADKMPMVHGIEIVPQAIEDAKVNAKNNNIKNVEFICAPTEEYLTEHADSIHADVIIMDPPRKGMAKEALEVVVNTAPEKIVYISCDSATLARDLRFLCDNGYELKKLRANDMFLQTVHCESVVLITRKDK